MKTYIMKISPSSIEYKEKGVGYDMQQSSEMTMDVERVVVVYSLFLRKIAFTYVKSVHDAEDVVQDVFVAYIRQQPRFESQDHERSWLIRVTMNKSKDFVKSGWFKNRFEIPENLTYLQKEQTKVLEAVLGLEDKYRLPIHLHYYEGYSINEIAILLSIKPATIGTRLARGRKQIKKILGGDLFE